MADKKGSSSATSSSSSSSSSTTDYKIKGKMISVIGDEVCCLFFCVFYLFISFIFYICIIYIMLNSLISRDSFGSSSSCFMFIAF